MRKLCITLLMAVLLCGTGACAENGLPGSQTETEEQRMIGIRIGEMTFTAVLEENATADAFAALLPMTLDMTELNGNEKYHYLMSGLPNAPEQVEQIAAGDLMLFGDRCAVLFYEGFPTPYTYTRIGHVPDTAGLSEALGKGNVKVEFFLITEPE